MRTIICFALTSLMFLSSLACTSPAPASGAEPEPPPQASSTPKAPDAELDEIKTRLEAVKTQLFDEGDYNCCVQPSCNWCALHEGSCDCFSNVQAAKAVCPGCGLGWHNGQGVVDGVDAADVKWEITHEHPSGGHKH
jgi:hypothetical protein